MAYSLQGITLNRGAFFTTIAQRIACEFQPFVRLKFVHNFSWLYVDLNSYFATVEQQVNPSLRGKAIAIGPKKAATGTIIAASIEAKRFGVKTGTLVGEAKRLCPGIIFCPGNHALYTEIHHRIVAAVERVLPVSAVLSIDEMACELTGQQREVAAAIDLAYRVKERILHDVGDLMSCSVGLAPNRYLAKLASDMQKPDGLIGLCKEALPQSLFHLKLRDFPGIGPRTEERMHRFGIYDVKSLCALSEDEMRLLWGSAHGTYFYHAIRGECLAEKATERRSIGHSHVLPPESRHLQAAELIAQKLLHKAAHRLRRKQFTCAELTLSVSFQSYQDSFIARERFPEACDDISLLQSLRRLWREIPSGRKPIKLGVTLGKLSSPTQHTLSLFANQRHENLAHAVDFIQARYGKNAIDFASMHKLENAAPDRIAFGNIPDFQSQ